MDYEFIKLAKAQLGWAAGELQDTSELKYELGVVLNSRTRAKELYDYTIDCCKKTYLPNTETTISILKVAKKHLLQGKTYDDIIGTINELFEGKISDLYKKLYLWNELAYYPSPITVRIYSYGGVPDHSEMLKRELLKVQAKYFPS